MPQNLIFDTFAPIAGLFYLVGQHYGTFDKNTLLLAGAPLIGYNVIGLIGPTGIPAPIVLALPTVVVVAIYSQVTGVPLMSLDAVIGGVALQVGYLILVMIAVQIQQLMKQ